MKSNELIFGIHTIEAFLKHTPHALLELYLQQGRADSIFESITNMATQQGISIITLERTKLDKLVAGQNHQGIVAKVLSKTAYVEADLDKILDQLTSPPFLLILDGIQDPHNLGACLRSANAAGVHIVIAPHDKSVGLTAVVRKVACGATELTPFIQVTNLARTLKQLKERGIWLFGAADDAPSDLYAANLQGPLALILGAEGKGLRRLTKELCDHLIAIPMMGQISSLNVSTATAVCLYEALRQRRVNN